MRRKREPRHCKSFIMMRRNPQIDINIQALRTHLTAGITKANSRHMGTSPASRLPQRTWTYRRNLRIDCYDI